ncbi:MAG: glycoside hydrolase family 3 C-terminal domain-containing protein [Pseudobutyrivibrio sp.]|nr:glycoside hydrolase family 3 C-terminal domain-containing protein [Pseudobutyrivibrio sp.]
MRTKKMVPVMRGVSACAASLLVLSSFGASVANTYRKNLDDVFGTTSYVTSTDADSARFVSDYETVEDMAAAAKDISVREGQEGTVIMKNDNNVLPLADTNQVALFGLAAYAPYPYNAGDFKGGNDDAVDLVQALEDEGLTINSTIKDFYVNDLLNKHEIVTQNQWTGADETSIGFDYIYNTTVGDMTDFAITEVPASEFENLGLESDWKTKVDKDNTVGICVFARAGGESNTYGTDTAVNYAGEATGEDPLKLSEDELSVIDAAKETCSKVIVLLNTGNAMMISDIAEGGAHEVDGIAYIGCINDYQCIGIADVLTGKVNATGALTETYVTDNRSIPAVQNFGGDYYADAETLAANAENGYDPRYPKTEISNESSASSFGGGSPTYSAGEYIVEAEGIYVGYKYYETRYFDSIVNPSYNAASAVGATQSDSWNYDSEVVYDFGHGLSYLDYEQNIKSIEVEDKVDGKVKAVIEVKNNSDQDGTFLAQLYVSQPYTDYDRKNDVEKSAVMFLNSAKVFVEAGQTADVEVEVLTKYLSSYDYKNAKTYILDDGDYYFTAAAGSHAATNNVLAAKGKTTADGMDAEAEGTASVWNKSEFDSTTFSIENDVPVTNVADDADLNYWTGEDTVTYLSRQDWEGTYPINYNKDVEITIADSDKAEQWIKLLKGQVYDIATDDPATEGEDKGLRFDSESIGYEQLENVNDDYWNELVSQISIDEAIGAVIHGGSQSDTITNVDNPIVLQNEGVCGINVPYTDEETGKTYHFNVSSQTLLGSSFNPDLAYEWGLVEGNSCLWVERYQLWGTGLTLKRTPYNGRNYEYISEDPMLTNKIGYGIVLGCTEKGIINGPKHLGFNDQEHNRNGISVYMTEQKFRETDLRGFQGALEEAKGLGIMIAFNRIGPTNASAYEALNTEILRKEWAYTGIISTDMMNNMYYFSPEGSIMAGITEMADFATNDNHINLGDGGVDGVWPYISEKTVKNDSALVEKARENLKYQLYTFANSAIMNLSTEKVDVWWDVLLNTIKLVSTIVLVLGVAGYVTCSIVAIRRKEEM